MNKTYRTVFNESTGTYVAAQETARGKGKGGRSQRSALIVAGVAALGSMTANAGSGGIEGCGTVYGSVNGNQSCTLGNSVANGGEGITQGFGLFTDNGASWANQKASIVGSQGGQLMLKGTAGITMRNTVLMSGNQIQGLAAGKQDTDAVNLSQLKAAGLKTDTSGNVTNSFVAYDDTTKAKATLGGGTAGTTIANVKAGALTSSSMDAVNGSQLFTTNTNVSNLTTTVNNINNGGGIKYFHVNSTDADSSAKGTNSIAIGNGATSAAAIKGGDGNVAIGSGAQIKNTGDGIIAIGRGSVVDSSRGVLGVTGAGSVIIGDGTYAYGGDSTVLGHGASTDHSGNVALGAGAVDSVGDAITNVDGRVTKNTTDITNIQNSITTMTGSVANAVQYDSAAHDKVTMGGAADAPKVKLTNLMDADLSETSSDAVTGAQLWSTNKQVADLNQAVINQAGSGNTNIAIDTNSSPASATGDNSVAIGGGSQATAAGSVAIGDGSIANEANTVSIGSEGNERRITNVAPGVNGTDATNVNQMNAMRHDMSNQINSVAKAAYGGVAAAMAMPNQTPSAPGRTVVSAGVANFKGYSAIAAGVTYRSTSGKWLLNAAASATQQGDAGVRAQVGYEF